MSPNTNADMRTKLLADVDDQPDLFSDGIHPCGQTSGRQLKIGCDYH